MTQMQTSLRATAKPLGKRLSQSFLGRSGVLIISSAVLQGLGFVFRIAINNRAGTQALALYQLIYSGYTILMAIALSGVTLAVSRFAAQQNALGNRQGVFWVRTRARGLFVGLFLLAALPTVLFVRPVATYLLGDPRTAPGLIVLLFCIALTGFENIDKAIFLGTDRLLPTTLSEVGELILRIVGVWVLLPLFPTLPMWQAAGIVVAMVLSECFSVAFLSGCFRKSLGKKPPCSKSPQALLAKQTLGKKIYQTALPICGSSVLNKLLFTANTVLLPQMLMVGGMSREAALGDFANLFSLAVPLTVLPTCVILPVAGLLLPKMSENLAAQKPKDNRRKAAKLLQLIGLCALPYCFYLVLLGSPISKLLYGQMRPAAYLFLLAPAALFEYYEIGVANLLNGLGKTFPAAASIVVEGLVLLAGSLFLAPKFGVLGFCVGKAASTLVAAIINLLALKKALPMKWRWGNWLGRPLLAAIMATCITRLAYAGLCNWLSNANALWPLTLATCCFLLVYLCTLGVLGTRPIAYLRRTLFVPSPDATPSPLSLPPSVSS